ncbi:FDLD family class I lanthipeptide [Nocardia vaccinii]
MYADFDLDVRVDTVVEADQMGVLSMGSSCYSCGGLSCDARLC